MALLVVGVVLGRPHCDGRLTGMLAVAGQFLGTACEEFHEVVADLVVARVVDDFGPVARTSKKR